MRKPRNGVGGMNVQGRGKRILTVAALSGVSIPVGVVAAWLLERLLVPNPCHYHTGEYLAGKSPPWWIAVLFWQDGMNHPEAGPLLYAASIGLVAAGIGFAWGRWQGVFGGADRGIERGGDG